jgi:riboflavin kinase / FMN adenylyltransferase
VTVGTFDGIHMGHRSILDRLIEIGKRANGETVVVTFEPHPRIALKKDHEKLKLLNTLEEKAELLEAAGIEHLVIQNFSPGFSGLSEQEFIREYLVKRIHVSTLVIGYDHRFGFKRQGDYDTLSGNAKKYNFQVEEMPEKTVGAGHVSSTQIRTSLIHGDIVYANELLGYRYFITGRIVEGMRLGHKLGFPTANIQVADTYKLIPGHGAYAVKVRFEGKTFNGMCNIGIKPTFDGKTETIEVNIFDFDGDIYGKNIRISFIDRLREEKKFAGIEELQKQLANDRALALKILEENDKKS